MQEDLFFNRSDFIQFIHKLFIEQQKLPHKDKLPRAYCRLMECAIDAFNDKSEKTMDEKITVQLSFTQYDRIVKDIFHTYLEEVILKIEKHYACIKNMHYLLYLRIDFDKGESIIGIDRVRVDENKTIAHITGKPYYQYYDEKKYTDVVDNPTYDDFQSFYSCLK